MKRELVTEILALPVNWRKQELDRRLAESEANPEEGSTLEEVFARIRRAS